jgi:hypothetical protein
MTNKEIEQCRTKLIQILQLSDPDQKWKQAVDLALKVGAPVWPSKVSNIELSKDPEAAIGALEKYFREEKEKATAEIALNIHYALQTATMINMCKTANRNFWIAIVASLAAWTAVLTQLNCFK